MVEVLTGFLQQYYDHFITWYAAAGTLTQYVFLLASGAAVFLISVFMILARITK